MTTYYVDPLGTDDSGYGLTTGTGAWKSLEYALESGGLTDGDVVIPASSFQWFADSTDYIINCTYGTAAGNGILVQPETTLTVNVPTNSVFCLACSGHVILDSINITNTNSIACTCLLPTNSGKIVFRNGSINGNLTSGFIPGRFWESASTSATLTIGPSAVVENAFYLLWNPSSTVSGNTININGATLRTALNALRLEKGLNVAITGYTSFYGCDQEIFHLSGSGHSFTNTGNMTAVTTDGSTVDIVMLLDQTSWEEYIADNSIIELGDTIYWNTASAPKAGWGAQFISTYDNWFPLSRTVRFMEPDYADGHWSWPEDTKESPSLSSSLGMWLGDSIMYGIGASDDAHSARALFFASAPISGIDRDASTISGMQLGYCRALCDHVFTTNSPAPKYVFIDIGQGDLISESSTPTSDAILAEQVGEVLLKIKEYGAIPIFIGYTEFSGSDTAQDAVESWCAAHHTQYFSWLDLMKEETPSGWGTYYFTDIETDVHPNDTGHAFIAECSLNYFNSLNSKVGACWWSI